MQRPDQGTSAVRIRVAAFVALAIGTLILAPSAPAPQPGVALLASGAERVAVPEPASTVLNEDLAAARTLPPTSRPSPTPDTSDAAFPLGRAAVSIPDPAPNVEARAARSKVVFLGDSYTTGWNGAGTGRRGWPALVAQTLGWQTANLAVAGTGFMNPGWTGQTVGSRVAAAIRYQPDIVVVAAGHNDSRWSAATTARAADAVLDRLHRALPNAVLVVVAPIWSNAWPPTRCLDLRDHLRQKARSIGAIFVDPLRDRWFAGSRQRLIGPDGIHPTDAGHRYIAGRIMAAIAGPAAHRGGS